MNVALCLFHEFYNPRGVMNSHSETNANRAVRYHNNNLENTRYYINKYYEKEIDSLGVTRHFHYIYAMGGIVALHIATPTTDSMYYVHTDHLGSYCAITNQNKTVRQRNFFAPWGNNIGTPNYCLVPRGFTGHEHYPQFEIINMNGRLYDPVIARFFSPDKYVANSSFTQDFNRYTYARGCPLMYTDPDGEFVQYIFGAIMGAISGWQMGKAVGATGWKMAGFIIGGAGIGAATAGLGTYLSGAIAASTSFGAIGSGLAAAAVSGAVSGAANGLGFAVLNGSLTGQWNFNGVWQGAVSGFIGGGLGSYVGGTGGALLGGAASGAIGTALNGGKWSDILISAAFGAVTSAASYEISMGVEYAKYNKGGKVFGDLKYSGFRKMSVATQRSFARNQEAIGWILEDGTVSKINLCERYKSKSPPRPINARSLFHTHQQVGNPYLHHSMEDMSATKTIDNHVITAKTIYTYDPVENQFNPFPYNINYIDRVLIPSLITPNGQVFNISPFCLYLY